MGTTNTHLNLFAWQEAMRLVEIVYRDTAEFPGEETFGLKIQIRRAAVSVPSNIAEGAARNSSREFVQFLGIARGSLAELETQLELANRLGYLGKQTDSVKQSGRVGRLVSALHKAVRSKNK